MNPYNAYRRPEPASGWTRIDLILALYHKALERLDRAEAALKGGDPLSAVTQLAKTQLIVSELASGIRLDVNEEVGTNMLRLYEYAVHQLRTPQAAGIRNAREVLRTLADGFEAVREEANALERGGQVNSAAKLQMVLATA